MMGCAVIVVHDDQGRDVGRAVICGGRAIKPCVVCGQLSTRACDFKMTRRTCSAPLCERCTTRLPGEKDACPEHREVCVAACRRFGLEVPS